MLTVAFSIISILVLGLIAGGLIANRPPMMDPPGLWARLVTYLGTHVAETRPDHPFPELRPRFYALPPDRLYAVTREAIAGLGWGIASEDPASLSPHGRGRERLVAFQGRRRGPRRAYGRRQYA